MRAPTVRAISKARAPVPGDEAALLRCSPLTRAGRSRRGTAAAPAAARSRRPPTTAPTSSVIGPSMNDGPAAEQEPGDQGAEQADDHVEQQSAATADDGARQPPDENPDQKHDQDVHRFSPCRQDARREQPVPRMQDEDMPMTYRWAALALIADRPGRAGNGAGCRGRNPARSTGSSIRSTPTCSAFTPTSTPTPSLGGQETRTAAPARRRRCASSVSR